MKIKISTNNLSIEVKEEMWRIYHSHYNYTKESFMSRIHKNNYYAFYIHKGELVGFTGLRIEQTKLQSKKITLIYFGQTIVLSAFRGKGLLQLTGAKIVLKFFYAFLTSRVYYWCDALNYKPYMVFAKNFNNCYPSRKGTTPEKVNRILQYIGNKYYGDSFCQATGTVKKSTQLVNDWGTQLQESDLRNPDVRFYAEANPAYVQGHGLITIGFVTPQDFIAVIKKYLDRYARWATTKLIRQSSKKNQKLLKFPIK